MGGWALNGSKCSTWMTLDDSLLELLLALRRGEIAVGAVSWPVARLELGGSPVRWLLLRAALEGKDVCNGDAEAAARAHIEQVMADAVKVYNDTRVAPKLQEGGRRCSRRACRAP
jgi:hypothetical protein